MKPLIFWGLEEETNRGVAEGVQVGAAGGLQGVGVGGVGCLRGVGVGGAKGSQGVGVGGSVGLRGVGIFESALHNDDQSVTESVCIFLSLFASFDLFFFKAFLAFFLSSFALRAASSSADIVLMSADAKMLGVAVAVMGVGAGAGGGEVRQVSPRREREEFAATRHVLPARAPGKAGSRRAYPSTCQGCGC